MLHRFITNIKQQHLFPSGQQVLLAVSGGIDSVVLAHLMHTAGYPFAIAHCNFHLRPSDCDRDELFVRQLAVRYGVSVHVAQFSTQQYAQQHHLCIEDAARQLRYDYFERLRSQYGYAAILTAHHRDDAAETFFINLLRGTGLAGLHGILPVQGHVVRPLLPFGRSEIESYAQSQGLEHVEDYTNAQLVYRRNQVRHQVLPLLRSIQPGADQALQQTIQHLQSVESLYRSLLEPLIRQYHFCHPDGTSEVKLDFLGQPNAGQLLYEILRRYGFNGTTVQQILSSTRSGSVFYSPTHIAALDRGRLIITSPLANETSMPQINTRVIDQFDFARLDFRALPSNQIYLDAARVQLPLTLRHWRQGDRFQPLGLGGKTQLVSDYFTDHKYSLRDKQSQLLLVDAADQILWIVGRRTAHPTRVTDDTVSMIWVEVETIF